ncbi:MAG: flagellar hook-associated protein FlgK [Alphaproteobacteria bacterium]|nr:flagellar hook-associated protein FlgK [Alphaproteobacteria bacterium]
MSLTSALHSTYAGLSKIESQLSIVSSNITNADKAGYTVKSYESDYITANGITVPISGTIVGTLDEDLYESVIESYTEVGYYSTLADYIEQYVNTVGTTNGSNTLSAYVNDFEGSISMLETSPSDANTKANVVDDADTLARELKSLSATVQDLRLEADQDIGECVDTMNELLEELASLNKQIMVLTANGSSVADVEDDRMVALEELSEYIDVTYYINNNNQLRIYASTGATLLDSKVHEITYSAVTSVTSQSVYPGDFSAITVNSVDITTTIKSGKLAALVELRDEILVEEQEKLDEMADVLTETVNTIFNEGTSYPPRSELTSDIAGLTIVDAFAATGDLRVAVVDYEGVVQEVVDLDLSVYATIGGVVTALDGIAGMSATLNASGELVLTADNGNEGIAMNQMDSSVGADSETFSMYFGFSNVFTGEGAEYIRICRYLRTSSESLASSTLDNDVALAVGDKGIIAGDGTVLTAMSAALASSVSFNAAGDFSAQSVTLSKYANRIISCVANASEDATEESKTVETLYDKLKSTLSNKTGVNIDEETTKMVELESQYEASATMLSTILECFDTLIAAMN